MPVAHVADIRVLEVSLRDSQWEEKICLDYTSMRKLGAMQLTDW
jgi:hypothetical protein